MTTSLKRKKLEFLFDLEKNYPKSFSSFAAWTLKDNNGLCETPASELIYDYSMWTESWSFYFKNENGRTYDYLRMFEFFEYFLIEISLEEYKNREFELLFKRLESRL